MPLFRFSEFTLDTERIELSRLGNPIHIKPKAFQLLIFLVENAPKVVSQQTLDDHLWPNTFVDSGSLHSLIHQLREALDDEKHEMIRTAYGSGFAFGAPLISDSPPSRWQVILGDREFDLVTGENLVGRDLDARVRIDATSISRRHARIVIGDDEVRVEDLGSKNGTHVRERKIHSPTAVTHGDKILFGSVLVTIHRIATPPSTETSR